MAAGPASRECRRPLRQAFRTSRVVPFAQTPMMPLSRCLHGSEVARQAAALSAAPANHALLGPAPSSSCDGAAAARAALHAALWLGQCSAWCSLQQYATLRQVAQDLKCAGCSSRAPQLARPQTRSPGSFAAMAAFLAAKARISWPICMPTSMRRRWSKPLLSRRCHASRNRPASTFRGKKFRRAAVEPCTQPRLR